MDITDHDTGIQILIEYRLQIIKYYSLLVEEPMDYPLLILVVLFI